MAAADSGRFPVAAWRADREQLDLCLRARLVRPPPDDSPLGSSASSSEVGGVGDQEKCNNLITKSAELCGRTGALRRTKGRAPWQAVGVESTPGGGPCAE